MGFKKCPICELNYIPEEEKYCEVCKRAQRGGDSDDTESLCIECGENPAVRGSELCMVCLREARRQEKLAKPVEPLTGTELDVSELEDMEVPISDNDIPETEMEEIHKELGDDYVDEDEEDEADEADEDMD